LPAVRRGRSPAGPVPPDGRAEPKIRAMKAALVNKSEISVKFVLLSRGKFSWLPGLRKTKVGCCSIAAGDSSQKP
jgi:hypothetical protein